MAGRAAYRAAGDALAVQDRGDAALADAEAHGALVQAQPLVPVGGRYRTFVEVAAWRRTATPSAARNFMIVVRDTPNIAAHCFSVSCRSR